MASSEDETQEEIKPLLPKNAPSQSYGQRRPSRRLSTRNLDLASIEAAFNKGVRPSLLGSGSYQITLSWEHINVKVKIPGKRSWCGESTPATERLILNDISGVVEPGSLVAIMGASGSGKSTLLNVLTNRNTKDYITKGTFRLNGVEVGGGIKNISAYVQQDDLFLPTLTAREHLQFRALLRMDKGLDKRARLKRVEEIIVEMGLQKCADSRIGNPGGTKKGLSGGEKKRLSFASEALTGPPIFFCDEPTSSLDSYMAMTIVQTLTNMARRGATILCTIHQPSSEIFAMFGQIILLSEGRLAFSGKSEDCLKFFNSQGYPCPRNFNPADHYIMTMAIEPGKEEESKQRTNAICDAFYQSDVGKKMSEESVMVKNTADEGDHTLVKMVTEFAETSRYESSIFAQFFQLFWRAWTAQLRDPMLTGVRIGQAVIISVILGLSFLDLDVDQQGVQNINSALFLVLVQVNFGNMFAVLSAFPEEVNLVMREFGTGLYKMEPYYLTRTISEVPLLCCVTVVFGTLTYYMMGFHDTAEAYLINVSVLIISTLIAAALGYVISIICGEAQLALSIASPMTILFVMFGGMFLNTDDVPDYFIWLDAISWYKYSYEILIVNQWKDIDSIACDRSNITIGNMTIPGRPCAYVTGDDAINMRGFDKDKEDEDFGILVALWGAWYIIAYIALYIRGKRSRE